MTKNNNKNYGSYLTKCGYDFANRG